MRILFLATYFPRPLNPLIGPWALEQAKAFKDLGHDIEVISLNPLLPIGSERIVPPTRTYRECPAQHLWDGVKCYYYSWAYYPFKQFESRTQRITAHLLWLGWLSARKRLREHIAAFKPDVIFAIHTTVNGYIASKLSSEFEIPFFSVDQEIGDILICKNNSHRYRHFESVAKQASGLVSISQFMQKQTTDLFPNLSTSLIHNGGGYGDSLKEKLDSKFRREKRAISVFCCANIYTRKDIPLLIRAFDRVAERFPESTLRIAGSGPDQDKVDATLAGCKHKGQISLLGNLEPALVKKEMLQADVFALVGWSEPFGVVFLEAMSAGNAVILSEDAGAADVFNNGENAIFTKPKDLDSVVRALDQLLADPIQCRIMGKRAYANYLEGLDWRSKCREYIRLFESKLHATPRIEPSRNSIKSSQCASE